MIFLTLFWLAHYPTLSLISVIFHLHERTITQILKHTLVGMSKALKEEIRWRTDLEFERDLQEFFWYCNTNFQDAACYVDVTEIRISRPSDKSIEKKVWSSKKRQHSLNSSLDWGT